MVFALTPVSASTIAAERVELPEGARSRIPTLEFQVALANDLYEPLLSYGELIAGLGADG